jgi:hypothetical protein
MAQIDAKINSPWNDVARVRVHQQLPYGPHTVWRLRQGRRLDRLHHVHGPK